MEPVLIKISQLVYNTLNIYDYEVKDYKAGKKTPYDLPTLCASIKVNGLEHPIDVAPIGGNKFEALDGRWRIEAYKVLGITEILCFIHNVVEEDKTKFILIANLYRVKNELEQFREALIILKEITKGSGGDRYEKAVVGKEINPTGLFRYEKVIEMDEEIKLKYPANKDKKEKEFDLLKKFEDGKITISEAYVLGKKKLGDEDNREKNKYKKRIDSVITDKYVVFNEDSTDMGFLREFLKINLNILLKLGIVSVPYLNQRCYDEDDLNEIGKGKDPVKYIAALKKIFEETLKSTPIDYIQCVNIADSYDYRKDYLLSEEFVCMMREIGWHKINTIIWVKDGLMRGDEDTKMPGTWEYIYVFCKKENRENYKNNYYPINIYHDEPVQMIKMSGRRNPDGSNTKSKMALSKTYTRFEDHISEQKFIDYIETQNAGKDNRLMKKDHETDQVAMFPLILPLFLILTYSKPGDWTLDQMAGSGTTNACSILNNRPTIAIEKIPKYAELISKRLDDISKDYNQEMAEEIEKLFNEKFCFTDSVLHALPTELGNQETEPINNDKEMLPVEKDFVHMMAEIGWQRAA